MLRLLPFFLFLALALPVNADSIFGEAPPGNLVGDFGDDLNGHFVSITYDATSATITIPGGIVELGGNFNEPAITGPMADFGSMQVHDNAYGWIHVHGDFRMRADDVQPAGRGLFLDPLWLVTRDISWTHENGWLTVSANDVLISNDPAFQNEGPAPGAWALLQGDGDDAIMDWLAFGDAPFATRSIGDEVAMDFVGTLGDSQPDLLIRLEDDGHFQRTHDRFVFSAGTLVARSVNHADLANERGAFSFHAIEDGHSIVHLRLPEGLSGEVSWQQDTTPPAMANVIVQNVDPYTPLRVVPELIATWNEPVTGVLQIGDQTKQTLNPAYELSFRLTGLQPDSDYTYTLDVTDLAGNTATHQGTIQTGPNDGPSAAIEMIGQVRDGDRVLIQFNATLDDGTVPGPELIHVFIDKQPRPTALIGTDPYVVSVPANAFELRIEVNAPGGRVSETIAFDGGQESPGLTPVLLLAALAYMSRR